MLCQGESINVISEKLILSLFVPVFCFHGVVCCSLTQLAKLLLCSTSAGSRCK